MAVQALQTETEDTRKEAVKTSTDTPENSDKTAENVNDSDRQDSAVDAIQKARKEREGEKSDPDKPEAKAGENQDEAKENPDAEAIKKMRASYLRDADKLSAEQLKLKEEREALAKERADFEAARRTAEAETAETKKGSKPALPDWFPEIDRTGFAEESPGERRLADALEGAVAAFGAEIADLKKQVEDLTQERDATGQQLQRLSQAEVETAAREVTSACSEAAKELSERLGTTVTVEDVFFATEENMLKVFDPEKEPFTKEIAIDCFDLTLRRLKRSQPGTNGVAPKTKTAEKKDPPNLEKGGAAAGDTPPEDRKERLIWELRKAREQRGK